MRTLERIETAISMDDFDGGNLCDAIDLRTDVGVSRCGDQVTLQFAITQGNLVDLADKIQNISRPCKCENCEKACVNPKRCRFYFSDSLIECYVSHITCEFSENGECASFTITGMVGLVL